MNSALHSVQRSSLERSIPLIGTSIHIYPSSLRHESRMLRETESLVRQKIATRVLIVGIQDGALPGREQIDGPREIIRVHLSKSEILGKTLTRIVQGIEFYCRVFSTAVKEKPDAITAHSLSVLPLSCLLSVRLGCALFYDAHELETERSGLVGIRQKVARIVERICMRWVKEVTVVSPSIATWYRDTYQNVPVTVVRNFPEIRNRKKSYAPDIKTRLGLPQETKLFLYHGMFLPGRGIEEILKVFPEKGDDRHLVLVGYGPLRQEIGHIARSAHNVHILPAVPPEEVVSMAEGADVGIVLFRPTCLSHRFALPNKLFEYIAAGLPVIASDLPDIREVVRKSGGWCIEPSADSLTRILDELTNEDISRAREKVHATKRDFYWEGEEDVLVESYVRALNG